MSALRSGLRTCARRAPPILPALLLAGSFYIRSILSIGEVCLAKADLSSIISYAKHHERQHADHVREESLTGRNGRWARGHLALPLRLVVASLSSTRRQIAS